ncbi:hypothetical protein [Nostoc favosum]|uniref:Uncharacterized protein n=1 Tax=Nostoc favosum CHAB5714 TaxID=2780399 RepID=A0ABS8IC84_9NOSO|nr:hypothetical protein [Nostoc favosum]MCC5601680.1 hypothetical protein [Nostoc favosum CHAB5714]
MLEEEFRSQNSGAKPETPKAPVRIKTLADSLTQRLQSGIQTRDFLVDHQIYDLVGVQKRRLFIRFFGQNTQLNSDD